MKQHIQQLIESALKNLGETQPWALDAPSIQMDATKDKQHGDFASNIALMLAKKASANPEKSLN